MSGERFCSQCGQKRVENGKFCIGCGTAFGGSQTGGNTRFWVFVAAVFSTGLLIYLGILLTVKKVPSTSVSTATAAAAHDHSHDDDMELHALEKKAISGTTIDAMQLAGYLIQKGAQDRHFLPRAAEVLESVVQKHPGYALAHRTLGNLYYDLNLTEKAEIAYQRYLELYPQDPNYLTDYGTVLLANGKTNQAIDAYKKAISLFPDHYHAAFNLSIAYQRLNDQTQSQAYRQRAEGIEARVGKTLAPEVTLPELPDGEATAAPVATAPDAAHRYTRLETFFRNHEIVGPKMTGFEVANDVAVLLVRQFPMTQMPPFARKAFDTKIIAEMKQIEGSDAALEIRDADSQAVLATYSPDSQP